MLSRFYHARRIHLLCTSSEYQLNMEWMNPHYVYSHVTDGGIGIKHLTTPITTLRLSSFLQLRAEKERGYPWHFQPRKILRYGF
jgi:hypothetical protein